MTSDGIVAHSVDQSREADTTAGSRVAEALGAAWI